MRLRVRKGGSINEIYIKKIIISIENAILITGAMIPIPLFYDLVLGNFWFKAIENEYFLGFLAPVPIGIVSIPFLAYFHYSEKI